MPSQITGVVDPKKTAAQWGPLLQQTFSEPFWKRLGFWTAIAVIVLFIAHC